METGKFSINTKLWNRFKQIEPTFEEGGYYDNVLTWKLDDFEDSEIENLGHYLFILTRLTTKEDLEKAGINIMDTYYHLLHSSYFDKETFSERYISLGYKKPFGNGHIQGDIADCIDPPYIDYLMKNGMDILHKPTHGEVNIVEVIYKEGNKIKHMEIDSHKIDTNYVMSEFNKVLIEIIEKVDFKYYQYESTSLYDFRNLSDDGKLADIQVNNSVNLEFAKIIFPSRSYLREEFIDNVLK